VTRCFKLAILFAKLLPVRNVIQKFGLRKATFSVSNSDKRKNKRTGASTFKMTTISVAGPFGTGGQ
jgi:hypothetical protein